MLPVLAIAAAAWVLVRSMRPSRHFSWAEMGNPPAKYRGNARLVALQVLEPVRERIGPFSPTSAYRSPAKNADVDGNPSSLHMEALAVDIGAVNGLSVAEVYEHVKDIDFKVPVDIVYGAPDHWDHVHIEIDG